MKWEYMRVARGTGSENSVKETGAFYRQVDGDIEFFMKYINERGAEGWEFVTNIGSTTSLMFKREVS